MGLEPSRTGRRHKHTRTRSNGRGGVGEGVAERSGRGQRRRAFKAQPPATSWRSSGRRSGPAARGSEYSDRENPPRKTQTHGKPGHHPPPSSGRRNKGREGEREKGGREGGRDGENRGVKCQKSPRCFPVEARPCASFQLRVFHTAACSEVRFVPGVPTLPSGFVILWLPTGR